MMLMLLVRELVVVLNTRKLGHVWVLCKNYWVLVTTVKLVYCRKESINPQFQRETVAILWKNNDSQGYLQKSMYFGQWTLMDEFLLGFKLKFNSNN